MYLCKECGCEFSVPENYTDVNGENWLCCTRCKGLEITRVQICDRCGESFELDEDYQICPDCRENLKCNLKAVLENFIETLEYGELKYINDLIDSDEIDFGSLFVKSLKESKIHG